jgi:hypothetical protein
MQLTFSHETRARIERMAKFSGRTPEQVWDDAAKREEQMLLAHIPPQWRSAYLAGVLQFAMVTTPPSELQRPKRVERDNAYKAFEGQDNSVF